MKMLIAWSLAGMMSLLAHGALINLMVTTLDGGDTTMAAIVNDGGDATMTIALGTTQQGLEAANASLVEPPAADAQLDTTPPIADTQPVENAQDPIDPLEPEALAEPAEPAEQTASPDTSDAPISENRVATADTKIEQPAPIAVISDVPLPRAKPTDIIRRQPTQQKQQNTAKKTRKKTKKPSKKSAHKAKKSKSKRKSQKPASKTASSGSGKKIGKLALAGSAGKNAKRAYGARLRRWIARKKRYPASANGAKGSVKLTISLARSGAVRSARVRKSSGNRILDKAAVQLARSASPFPAVPSTISGSNFRFTITISYRR